MGQWGEHSAGELLRAFVSLALCFSPLPFVEVLTGMEHLSWGVTVPWIPALNGGGKIGHLCPAPPSQGVPQSSFEDLLFATRG